VEEARQYSAVTSNNLLLDPAFAAMFCWCAYMLGRMLLRREALVRDGWTKWSWEPASVFPGSYAYGLFMTSLLLVFSAWTIYSDLKGWR
jgi:hypothetical protein